MKNHIPIFAICLLFFASAGIAAENPEAIPLLKEAYRIADSLDPKENVTWLEPLILANQQFALQRSGLNGETARNVVLIKIAAGMARHGYLGTAREIVERMGEPELQIVTPPLSPGGIARNLDMTTPAGGVSPRLLSPT